MPELNPPQRAAVRYIDGPLLVLAGAGSGKTRVITHKIAYLIRECGLAPRHIAAVTFTNKAAREMRARVAHLLRGTDTTGLRVSTFHTLGLDIIRRESDQLGLRRGFSIYDNEDSAVLLRELMRREFGDQTDQAEPMLSRISHWKSRFTNPEQALADAGDDIQQRTAAGLYASYNHYLRTYNAVDFDDLIMLPVLLFREHPDVLERWQNRIRYLLVDEYQDTNGTQYDLVRQLVGVRAALTVVGDDDQSIYAWRGAQPENLAQLRQDFPGLEIIKLEQNYRSTGSILRAANTLIANNSHVFEKKLWSAVGPGEPLRVLNCRDADHEAERVVGEILHRKFHNRAGFGDFAILYRGNHQSRLFERTLREHNIPYRLSGGTSFFAYTEVKDIMAYLRLVANPDDDNAFLRIANTPRRGIGPSTIDKLAGYARGRRLSLLAASFEIGLEHQLDARALAALRPFVRLITEIADRAERGDGLGVVRELVGTVGYDTWIRESCNNEKSAERRLANVQELVAWLERMARQEPNTADLADLVARLSLLDMLDRQDDDQDSGDRVHLMTLHAAKGLEFRHVFMVGMEEELLPHRTSLEQEALEEERRLAYVGITRAQRSLSFSYAARRQRYGDNVDCEPSRFLSELPAELLDWDRTGDSQQTRDTQRGNAYLANLRTLLADG